MALDYYKHILNNPTLNEIIKRDECDICNVNVLANEIYASLPPIEFLGNGYSRAVFREGDLVYKIILNKCFIPIQWMEATIFYHLGKQKKIYVPKLHYINPILLVEEFIPEPFPDEFDLDDTLHKLTKICNVNGIILEDCNSEDQYRVRGNNVFLCDAGNCILTSDFKGTIITEDNYMNINFKLTPAEYNIESPIWSLNQEEE